MTRSALFVEESGVWLRLRDRLLIPRNGKFWHNNSEMGCFTAYQVLLSEELARCGVELIFLKAPAGATPEDQLLVQFQGMIAEYERAQIAERCRRGKKHMAQQGGVNVLSGALSAIGT